MLFGGWLHGVATLQNAAVYLLCYAAHFRPRQAQQSPARPKSLLRCVFVLHLTHRAGVFLQAIFRHFRSPDLFFRHLPPSFFGFSQN